MLEITLKLGLSVPPVWHIYQFVNCIKFLEINKDKKHIASERSHSKKPFRNECGLLDSFYGPLRARRYAPLVGNQARSRFDNSPCYCIARRASSTCFTTCLFEAPYCTSQCTILIHRNTFILYNIYVEQNWCLKQAYTSKRVVQNVRLLILDKKCAMQLLIFQFLGENNTFQTT